MNGRASAKLRAYRAPEEPPLRAAPPALGSAARETPSSPPIEVGRRRMHDGSSEPAPQPAQCGLERSPA
eukprot:15309423-Alexandrium_andersonii.AAC.1